MSLGILSVAEPSSLYVQETLPLFGVFGLVLGILFETNALQVIFFTS